jgi:pilus assembly protein CpaB
MKQKIILVVSILFGLIGFWLTASYLQSQRAEFERQKRDLFPAREQMKVVAAAKDLPSGTTLRMEDIGEKTVSKHDFGDKVVQVKDFRMILGKKLKFPLKAKEPIEWNYVDVPYFPGSGLAGMIKVGLRAASITVGGSAAVSGLIQPNDRVDIIGTFSFPSKTLAGEMEIVTLTILQDVTVLACGQNLARQVTGSAAESTRRGATAYNSVTFEVSPSEAELLIFAENMKGRLSLILRNPEDINFKNDLPEINFKYLEKKIPELNLDRQQNIRHRLDL